MEQEVSYMANLKYTKFISVLKNNKYQLMLSAVILSGVLVLGGCASESKTIETENKPASNIPIEINDAENASDNDVSVSEEDVVNYFNDMEKSVTSMLKSDNVQSVKEDAIDIFITATDFLFYGGEVKGYTFSELSTEAKKSVIESVETIDSKIEKNFPGYKSEVSEKYNMGKDWLSEKMKILLSITEKELGEEAWSSLLETKIKISEAGSSLIDSASKVYEKSKQKANNWYNNFKEEHK